MASYIDFQGLKPDTNVLKVELYRYGYRVYTTAEIIANYTTWRDVGVRMGIKDIPDDLEVRLRIYLEGHLVCLSSFGLEAEVPMLENQY